MIGETPTPFGNLHDHIIHAKIYRLSGLARFHTHIMKNGFLV
jgi:hypothetical protein